MTRGARQCTTEGACAVGDTVSLGPAVREVQEACVGMQPLSPASTDSTHTAVSEGRDVDRVCVCGEQPAVPLSGDLEACEQPNVKPGLKTPETDANLPWTVRSFHLATASVRSKRRKKARVGLEIALP